MLGKSLICVTLSAFPAMAQVTPSFEPRQVPELIYAGGWEHFVGGGVSGFDCNGDGFTDAFLAGGENPAQLWVNKTGESGAQIVYEAKEGTTMVPEFGLVCDR